MNEEQSKPKDALSAYREHIKWVVGLSTGAVGGLLLHYEQLLTQPTPIRWLLVIAATLFLVCVWGGIVLLQWIAEVPTYKDGLQEIEQKLADPSGNDEKQTAKLTQRQTEIKRRLTKAQEQVPGWQQLLLGAFAFALVSSGIGIVLGGTVYAKGPTPPPPPPKPSIPPSHYSMVYSAVHATGHGREAHTFLLDETKGEVWQMVCRKEGGVSFQRVHRLNFDGQVEDASAGTPAEK